MKLSNQRFVFAVDVERNDATVPPMAEDTAKAFNAIAAKVLDTTTGVVVDEYVGRLPDGWFSGKFAQGLLPSVADIPVVGDSPRELFADFWQFWLKWHAQNAYVWADTAKLESIFFEEVMSLLGASFKEGPWRVDDIRVLMLALGYDADEIKSIEFAGLSGQVNRHDPRGDCDIVIACYRRCIHELSQR